MNTNEKVLINLAAVNLREEQRARAQYALRKAEAIVNGLFDLVGALRLAPRASLSRPRFGHQNRNHCETRAQA